MIRSEPNGSDEGRTSERDVEERKHFVDLSVSFPSKFGSCLRVSLGSLSPLSPTNIMCGLALGRLSDETSSGRKRPLSYLWGNEKLESIAQS